MKVLIAIDHSQASQFVLKEAAVRPWPRGTTFCVLNVVDAQLFAQLPELVEEAKRDSQRLVKSGAETLSRAGYETLSEVIVGFPRKSISEYAREWQADLIIAGAHSHSAIGRFLVGSVAQGILRTAHCSVEIARPAISGAPPSSHPMKILLATDGSPCSLETARMIASRPWPRGTEFKVLSAEELLVLDTQMAASSLSPVYPSSLLEELITLAHDRATAATAAARDILIKAGAKVLEDLDTPVGDPRDAILCAAKTWAADLIVLGSHGRRGVDRFVMGSVSEGVAIHATCSVEVIRK